MSEWIKCSDRLPEEEIAVWAFDGKNVFDLTYDKRCFDAKLQSLIWGFHDDSDHFCCDAILDITHWMPYFTPDPPK